MSNGGGGDGGGYPPNPNHYIMYAAYVESWHNTWLSAVNTHWGYSVANNPYGAYTFPYDPDTDLDAMLAALNAYCNVLLNFHNTSLDIDVVADAFDKAKAVHDYVPQTQFLAHLAAIDDTIDDELLDTDRIDTAVNEYSEQLQADIEEKTLPAFEAGMRDINAVMSSAFLIGEALIFAEKNRNVAKFRADLMLAQWSDRNKALINIATFLTESDMKMFGADLSFAEMTGKFWIQGVEYKRLITDKIIDVLRMKIVAKKEENDETLRRYAEYIKWPLAMSQYAASMLGSAGGGHAVPEATGGSGSSSVSSVLGGIMAGASVGAMFNSEIGGAWGSAIGGAVGGAAALLG